MKALGRSGSSNRSRDHGVTADYVRKLDELGYKKLTLDQLRSDPRPRRDAGLRQARSRRLGYKGLSPDDLVTLRDHGVTAERIRQANAKAGSQLSVAQLRDAASHGWR